MKKNKLKNIAGLTLIEMLIGVVISSIMMAAIYTTYTVVNNSYGQVTERAKISRSGRDIVEMMMRDIRMAGFKYILGTNTLDLPNRSYLQFVGGDTSILESHDPLIIEKGNDALGPLDGGAVRIVEENHPDEGSKCCDRLHIVYDDFNQNDATQPYKRYKITYFGLQINNEDGNPDNDFYGVYKTKESWIENDDNPFGNWTSRCTECYTDQLVRSHLVDMEFLLFDENGHHLWKDGDYPLPNNDQRINLYKIKQVDMSLIFLSLIHI